MWLIIVPLLSLAVLITGIVLIIKRSQKPWFLWTGIGLIVLYILSLPVVLPFFLLAMLLITGGSFS
ncbi:hypothetical protein K8R03_03540 [Candidatus Kaiserbacteria bacterium]|nr:hypothetical protein [Candidatus Kaiserbacteria bacterium]